MTRHHTRDASLALLFLFGVVACGGEGQVAGGGIGGTGISQGPVTGFGSVWVNGVEFSTTNATITRDGAAVTQDDLELGMLVTVYGTINGDGISGTASSVSYAKELEGPISALPNANTLTVLGQTVLVDNLTKIKINGVDATISDLQAGDTVEVSGLPTPTGFRATYIEAKSLGAEVELKGKINAVANGIITIGAQNIDIRALSTSFTPQLGDYVAVKGTLLGGGATLLANSIEQKSRALGAADKDNAELQGYVTTVTAASDFVVDAQPVRTSSQTRFKGGTAADIKTGARLEVTGALVNGVLLATKISFEDDLNLEGDVTSVSGTTITIDTNSGLAIEINATLTEGATTVIKVGDHVKLRGRKLDATHLLATELEVSAAGGGTRSVELQGAIDSISIPFIRVLGLSIDTTTIASFGGDGVSNSASFFSAARVGSLVEIKGTRTGVTMTWESIELDE